jgi:hypothetical protein
MDIILPWDGKGVLSEEKIDFFWTRNPPRSCAAIPENPSVKSKPTSTGTSGMSE